MKELAIPLSPFPVRYMGIIALCYPVGGWQIALTSVTETIRVPKTDTVTTFFFTLSSLGKPVSLSQFPNLRHCLMKCFFNCSYSFYSAKSHLLMLSLSTLFTLNSLVSFWHLSAFAFFPCHLPARAGQKFSNDSFFPPSKCSPFFWKNEHCM